MLYKTELRYRLRWGGESPAELNPAVKLHGALMNAAGNDLAEYLHRSQLHPFSLCCIANGGSLFVRICALNDETSGLCDRLLQLKTVEFYGCETRAELMGCEFYEPVSVDEAADKLGENVRVEFVTPAMYRSKGRSMNTPEPEKYFYSAVCKMNEFENCRIEFDDFLKAWRSAQITGYSYQSAACDITGWRFPGMTGQVTLRMPKNAESSLLLKKVLAYSEYSGVGAKTGQGMGGIRLSCGR